MVFEEARRFAVNVVVVVVRAMVTAFLSGRSRLVRPALGVFALLCLADWVLIQDLSFLGGLGTDPKSMIPFVLLARAVTWRCPGRVASGRTGHGA